jgi:hypothetical protein
MKGSDLASGVESRDSIDLGQGEIKLTSRAKREEDG